MLSRVDPKDLQVLAELEASRYGDLLKRVLRNEDDKVVSTLIGSDASKTQRLQGRAEAIRDILALLNDARQHVRKQPA